MNDSPFDSLRGQVDEILQRYPVSKRSAALPVLHLLQERFGCVSNDAIEWAARQLELQPVHLLELVTFYPMLRQHPVGQYHIKVCRTLSCQINGAEPLRDHLLRKLNVRLDETTPDGGFTVSEVECLASCGTAPCMMVNDDLHESVTPEKADGILAACRSQTAPHSASS
jgi:NADH-quinone oxidoreductase subunit E